MLAMQLGTFGQGEPPMAVSIPVMVTCRIGRSAFSGERIFVITQADGTEYVGAAPREVCFTTDYQPIGDAPKQGEQMNGYIQGALIGNGGDEARVALPDGEAIRVKAGNVFRGETRELHYVPLGS
jgi:hypothetical protein